MTVLLHSAKIMQFIEKAMKKLARGVIWLYQVMLSPWLGARCRFSPSCSAYMQESIEKYGIFKGGWMGLKRLSRCHPWGGSGHDPVP